VTSVPSVSNAGHWHAKSSSPLQPYLGYSASKQAYAHVGTAAMARLAQAVAVAVTVDVARGARSVVLGPAVTPRQLHAALYSTASPQEEA
jgi:hypothetical protein